MMRRVAIVYKFMPHYRQRFFELLRERLRQRGIELILIYGEPGPADRSKGDLVHIPWGIRIKQRIWRIKGRDLIWQSTERHLKNVDLVIVEQANKLLLNYVLLLRQFLGGTRVAFWGHGRCFQVEAAIPIAEAFKRWLSRRAHWFFSYNERSTRILKDFGFPEDRITDVQNAIDTRSLIDAKKALTSEQLDLLRQQLKIQSNNVGIYIGGMYPTKRLGFLLDCCRRIRELVPDFEMIFIGAGPDSDTVSKAASEHSWIHYVGARFNEDKVPYAALASCFLMPGLVGLAILDTFALEIPLVTTAYHSHSPEIAYLIDGENGLMVQEGESVEAYSQAVTRVLNDAEFHEHLVAGCRRCQTKYTVEEMARRFAEGVEHALAGRRPAPTAVVQTRWCYLTNFIPPYRVPFLEALQRKCAGLIVVLSTSMEANRHWSPQWGSLKVRVQKAWTFNSQTHHQLGFQDRGFVHIPRDTFAQLRRAKPDIILTSELGMRSLQAAIYRILHPRCRLIVQAALSEHTEQVWGLLRQALRYCILHMADGVIVNGQSGRRYVQRFGVPTHRISHVPYATDLATFDPAGFPRSPSRWPTEIRLLSVGQLIPRKGLMPFLEALCTWTVDNPGSTVRWKLLGSGPLQTEIEGHPKPPNLKVVIVGDAQYREVPGFLADCDIMAFPTLADEWGMVVNEAMAMCIPVLASHYSQAADELVEPGVTGWLFEGGNPASIRRAFDQAFSVAADQLTIMGRRGRQVAEANGAEPMAQRALEAGQRAMQPRPSGSSD